MDAYSERRVCGEVPTQRGGCVERCISEREIVWCTEGGRCVQGSCSRQPLMLTPLMRIYVLHANMYSYHVRHSFGYV